MNHKTNKKQNENATGSGSGSNHHLALLSAARDVDTTDTTLSLSHTETGHDHIFCYVSINILLMARNLVIPGCQLLQNDNNKKSLHSWSTMMHTNLKRYKPIICQVKGHALTICAE